MQMIANAAKSYVIYKNCNEEAESTSRNFWINLFNNNKRVIVKLWGSSKMLKTLYIFNRYDICYEWNQINSNRANTTKRLDEEKTKGWIKDILSVSQIDAKE